MTLTPTIGLTMNETHKIERIKRRWNENKYASHRELIRDIAFQLRCTTTHATNVARTIDASIKRASILYR